MASALETLLLAQYAYLQNNTPQLYSNTYISATTASVTLTVPSGYNNLEVVWRARCSDANAGEQLYLRLNGDSGSNYLWEVTQGNNATAAATTSGAATTFIQIGTVCAASATANYFSSGRFTVAGASDTANYKTACGTGAAFAATNNMWSGVYSGQWNSTAAVTSITLQGATGSFVAGSRFSLYVSY